MHRRDRTADSGKAQRCQDDRYFNRVCRVVEHIAPCDNGSNQCAIVSQDDANPMSPRATFHYKIRRQRHLEMLVISLIVIALSWLLDVSAVGRVFLSGFPNWPVPETCLSRDFFGVDCPGCGLTRSYIYLIHGHWNSAWSMHRLGWLLFIVTVFQVPYRLIALHRGERELISPRVSRWIGSGIIALLIVNWLIGLWNWF